MCLRYNSTVLKEEGKQKTFQNKINEQMNATNGRVEIDELAEIVEANWIKFKSNMAKAAEEVLGYQGKQDRRLWFDEDCQVAINHKNDKYKEYIGRPTRIREEAYKEARRNAVKICRRKKRVFLNKHLLDVEEN